MPGFLFAFWLAERYRDRFRGREGWRGSVGNFLESIHLIRVMFADPRRYGIALAGMALFWAADAFAAWSGMAAFGFKMNAASFFVGFATGMVFTRRTGPPRERPSRLASPACAPAPETPRRAVDLAARARRLAACSVRRTGQPRRARQLPCPRRTRRSTGGR